MVLDWSGKHATIKEKSPWLMQLGYKLGVKDWELTYCEDVQMLRNKQNETIGIVFSKFDEWNCSSFQRNKGHFSPLGRTLLNKL